LQYKAIEYTRKQKKGRHTQGDIYMSIEMYHTPFFLARSIFGLESGGQNLCCIQSEDALELLAKRLGISLYVLHVCTEALRRSCTGQSPQV
jgi:hypothetical protein